MKLSKNSVHYKLVEYIFGHSYFYVYGYGKYDSDGKQIEPQRNITLCKYFWTFVVSILVAVPVFFWRLLPAWREDHRTLGGFVTIVSITLTILAVLGQWRIIEGLGAIGGIIGAGVLGAICIAYLYGLYKQRQQNLQEKGVTPTTA